MLNIFQRADQEKSRGADITARDLLETGRKDVLTRLAGQPRLQAELLRGIAKIQSDMGEYVTADSTFAELVRIHSELRQPREEAMARTDHAYNALQMNNLVLAARLLEGAQPFRGLFPEDFELNARQAEVKGRIALNGGDAEGARAQLSAARDVAIRALGAENLRAFTLGQALFRAERALSHFEAAVKLQDELRRLAGRIPGIGASEIAEMDFERINLLGELGRFAQALDLLDVALPQCIDALGAQQQTCRFLVLVRGHTLLKLGKTHLAMQVIPQLRVMQQDANYPSLQVESLILEFRLQSMVPNASELPGLFEKVRGFAQSGSVVAIQPAFKAAALLALAESKLRSGDPDKAREWADLVVPLLGDGAKQGGGLQLAAVSQMLTGIALIGQNKPELALDTLGAAQAAFAKVRGPEHPTTQLFALNYALALAELHRWGDAVAVVRHAELVLREAFGASSPTYQQVLALLRRLEVRQTEPPGAGTIAAEPSIRTDAASWWSGFFR
jgi:hypothetical protein